MLTDDAAAASDVRLGVCTDGRPAKGLFVEGDPVIEIDLPEPGGQRPLPLELRTVRGERADAPNRLTDRVVLGEPAVRRLTADTVTGDDELRGFLTAKAASACYWFVQFTCTFDHDDELPFVKTWLQLALASNGDAAVAHSMEPLVLTGNRVVTWGAKLTFPCVFTQLEVDIGGQVTTEEVSCEGRYEGTAKPTWWYYKTSAAPVRGPKRMRLVARTPAGGGLSATVRVGATAEHERFGRKPLSYDMPPDPGQQWLAATVASPAEEA
jgi:hypothetical protein